MKSAYIMYARKLETGVSAEDKEEREEMRDGENPSTPDSTSSKKFHQRLPY